MAGGLGGLGGLGGFGNVLQALGQSLLTSPSGNPFETLPANMQAVQQQREHLASLGAMSAVAEKLGIPKEIAANPLAMSLLIQQMNTQRTNALTQQYLGQSSSLTPPGEAGQPGMRVTPPASAGGLGGLGGATDAAPVVTPKLPAFADIQGATPSGKIAGLVAQAAQRYGQDPSTLIRTAQIESGLNPAAQNPSSSAGGLFQFIDSTAKQYGLTNKKDPAASADAGARLMRDNANQLRQALGRDPQPWELYLAHQQGGGGAAKLLANPNARAADLVGAAAVRQNGGSTDMTAAQFAGLWRKRFGDLPQTSQVAAAGDVPLPPPRPAQLALNDPNAVPAPSPAMQRVQDEARARGIGQSGAPLDQVAASGKSIPVPINPPALPTQPSAPAAPPAAGGATGNTTKTWAQQNFDLSLKRIAVAEQAGLKGIVEAEKAKLPIYTKYLTPSEQAIRVQEAGLTGTPMGRAIIAGLPGGVQEKLAEQLVPGYEAPGTLEQKRFGLEQQKYGTSLDQQAWQRAQTELDRQQRERLATMTPAEKAGMAQMRAPAVVAAGRAAEVAQKAAEAAASTGAAARTKYAEQATAAADAADKILGNVAQARAAYDVAAAGGGIGPRVAGDLNRSVTASLPAWTQGGKNEIARQQFDSAMAAIAADISRARNKGLGQRSNMEHILATADLPKLTSSSPKVASEAFGRLEEELARARELDKRYGLFGGEQQMTPRADQAPPVGTTRSGVRWSVQ